MGRNEDAADHPNVMVSSTYSDLSEHREAVTDALLRLSFFPLGMEFDSSKAGKDVIDSSLEMVDKARAYVGIVSHRYGGVPADEARNPGRLSITELEYRRALERGIPVYMFLISAKHPVLAEHVEEVEAYKAKLRALREDAESRSICKQFTSVEDLKSLVIQSMAEFKIELSRRSRGGRGGARARRKTSPPRPPQLLAVPDFISGHEFVGRAAELNWLDEWARARGDSLMVVEAIGGMGKSTLAWRWVNDSARTVRPDLAGVCWYSFYEGGADMASFAAHALAYTTGQPLKKLSGRKTTELAQALVAALHRRPFLLVLDGLERVLVAYHRLDASQARDDQVSSDRQHHACIKPADEELLRQLVAAAPSKVLITSRLLPTALTNKVGQPLPTVSHRELRGLHADDALRMMRNLGVRGDGAAIRRYLEGNFENHPLLVGLVAGLVNDYIRDPGNFDRWAEDPQGGAALSLAALDLRQRRTHILAAALSGLEPGTRQLLSRIAALSDAVHFDTIAALNPFVPPPPPLPPAEEVDIDGRRSLTKLERFLKRERNEHARRRLQREMEEMRASIKEMESAREAYPRMLEEHLNSEEVRQALPKLVSALRELERRGLLHWDRQTNSYDMHPVVRGYAFDILEDTEKKDICNLIVDHFQSKPADSYAEAKTLADVQQSINIFRALAQAGRFDDAASFFVGDFSDALLFSVEAQQEILALMKPLFPDGFQEVPRNIAKPYFQGALLTIVAITLLRLNRFSEAAATLDITLRHDLNHHRYTSICTGLINLGIVHQEENRITRSFAAFDLALELAMALGDNEGVSRVHLDLMAAYSIVGLFEEAEAAYHEFRRRPVPVNRGLYRPGMADENLCWLRFYQGTLTDELLDKSEATARDGNNRRTLRNLSSIRGELALRRGDSSLAVKSFERVIELTQKVGLPVGVFEARLALAKAKAGDKEQALAICERLHESAQPPHAGLAEAYLEIGDREAARQHALEGYGWAWADGLPYSRHWELERCREVLRALGEPEPRLPPLAPEAVEPIPLQKEIRALIAKLEKEKRAKKVSPS